jgi:hypothetical protein
MISFRQMLFLPAVLLGMLFAIPCAVLFESVSGGLVMDAAGIQYTALFALGVLAIYGTLTYFVFKVKESTFALSPNQLRVIWIGAFLLGAFGTPWIVSIL